jgi:cytochrome bd-type quinol oxidase subunit 2
MTIPEEPPSQPSSLSAREAYLQNQHAVATAGTNANRQRNPLRIAALVAGVVAVALLVATVVSYYGNPQEEGSTDIDLPTATSFFALGALLLTVLPFLIEERSIAARIRNVIIAAVIAFVLALLGIAVFISVGSLIADLLYNVSH